MKKRIRQRQGKQGAWTRPRVVPGDLQLRVEVPEGVHGKREPSVKSFREAPRREDGSCRLQRTSRAPRSGLKGLSKPHGSKISEHWGPGEDLLIPGERHRVTHKIQHRVAPMFLTILGQEDNRALHSESRRRRMVFKLEFYTQPKSGHMKGRIDTFSDVQNLLLCLPF